MSSALLVAVAIAVTGCTASAAGPPPSPSVSASGDADVAPASDADTLAAYDWRAITVPASSCDPDATGDITLVDGKGELVGDEFHTYSVVAQLPPDIGELAEGTAAVLRLTCFLEGANALPPLPFAIFAVGDDGPELIGLLHNTDLGVSASGSALVVDALEIVDGQIVVTGAYLTDQDAHCCPSGVGWTWIAVVHGRMVTQGYIADGAPPAELPARGARAEGDLIIYDPPVEVQEQSDLELLEGAPQDFKDFIWTQKQQNDGPGCDSVITVSRLHLAGFASGGVGCDPPMGGAALLWIERDGAWSVLLTHQDTPPCDVLTAAQFPASVLGDAPECADAQWQPVPYAP
ncbi:hypothetical protein [Microbacterium jejuense]|uniref:hypothetical protein n=1 Tax=Microbacterium jejuense TaxID=1263637 RepID=UPI0031F0D6AF